MVKCGWLLPGFATQLVIVIIVATDTVSLCLYFYVQSGRFVEDMIPTVGFNMRKVTKGNVTIKVCTACSGLQESSFCLFLLVNLLYFNFHLLCNIR